MKSLEEILQEYHFIAPDESVWNDTDFTDKGYEAYKKLISLIGDISILTDISCEKVVRELDKISYEV